MIASRFEFARPATSILAAASVLLLGACGTMGMGRGDEGGSMSARLTGAAEVPGPGDTDGRGSASIRFSEETPTQLCFDVTVQNIDTATAGHIHRGAAGVAGPVVVPLAAPADGSSSGCVDVAASLKAEIMANPGGFYVNIHNAPFPNGAVRGQLAG